MDKADLGSMHIDGALVTITFTRRLSHPQEEVWRAVTEPEHLASWFPQRMEGERAAGARLRFLTDGDDGDDGFDGFDGQMLQFDPPHVMELLWGTDRLRIELRADGDTTVLTLSDAFSELGKAARDAAGWHECLDRLQAAMDGDDMPAMGSRWAAAHSVYVERFGPEAATIGPPEGGQEAVSAQQ